MTTPRHLAAALLLGSLAFAADGVAQTDPAPRGPAMDDQRPHAPRGLRVGHGDHRHAREARRAGAAMPLAELLPQIERQHRGRVVGVGIEPGPRLAYRFRLLHDDGRVADLRVDAQDGSPLDGEDR